LRSATIADPHTNILRATAAAVAASLGGCESLDVTPFDAAFALPSDFSRRIALNTQHLLREESGMGEVLDPAGGSWYLEALTDALARKAWAQFQAIERQGGLAAALAAGLPQQQIAAQAQQRAQDLATRRQILIGVNQYVDPQLPWPAEILPSAHRDASPFEALRALAAAQAEPPRAFLAIVGPVARLAARIEFVTQFLLVGGIAPINAGSFASAAEAAAAALASAAPIVVICAADSAYPQLVPEIAALLRAAGAEVVLTLAGQPPEQIAALRAAGIEFFFHQRADLLLTLDALLRRTENPEPRTDP
jgi:methylmalonyl-CoA mutase